MKGADRSVFLRLLRAARTEMRAQRPLWKEYKRVRKSLWRRLLNNFGPYVGYFYLIFLFFGLSSLKERQSSVVPLIIALYATGTAVFRTISFRAQILTGQPRLFSLFFPVSDDDLLRGEAKGFTLSWLRAFIVIFTAYLLPSISSGLTLQSLPLTLVIALLQAVCAAALGLWLLAIIPHALRPAVYISFYLLAAAVLFLPEKASFLGWSLVAFLPGGWISHAYLASIAGDQHSAAMWITPAIVLAISLPLAASRAAAQLRLFMQQQTTDPISQLVVQGLLDPSVLNEENEQYSVPAAYPDISSSHFLLPPDWSRSGWIERIVASLYSPRQRVVAEFMLADQLGNWSSRWRKSAIVAALGFVIIAAHAPLPSWTIALPLVISAMLGTPLLGGLWLGFHVAPTAGKSTPAYAAFPLGYFEISLVMLKASLVRILFWSPFPILLCAALAPQFTASTLEGSVVGAKIVLLIATFQPVAVLGHFSAGSDDTKRVSIERFLAFIAILFFALLYIVATVFLFQLGTEAFLWQLACLGVTLVSATASWFIYMLLFDHGGIDLSADRSGNQTS